jgi:CubicO group peptidase (beta-lactamase class C family)
VNDTVDAVLEPALGKRFTGAVVRVEQEGRLVLERAYGRVDEGASSVPVDGTTRFDLASLTKVFVATTALQALEAGALALNEPLAALVPEWNTPEKARISLRQLLAHDAGLQSGADYRELFGSDVERYSLERPLVARVGERVVYSDLGFIALGVVLARALGTSLSTAVERTCRSVGASVAAFRPRALDRAAIPASEDDGWRGRVRGEVHDEKCWLMNGVAGHAGLFGTAADVARLAEAYLGAINGRPGDALGVETAREATREQAFDPVLRRGLGWALKTSDENSCGALMSAQTFGHTGFTGTCVWVDPVRDLTIVLLTNAVYYGRHDLRDVRAGVCDAITAACDAAEGVRA